MPQRFEYIPEVFLTGIRPFGRRPLTVASPRVFFDDIPLPPTRLEEPMPTPFESVPRAWESYRQPYRGEMLSYSARAPQYCPLFIYKDKQDLGLKSKAFYGVELELQCKEKVPHKEAIVSLMPFAIAAQDSTTGTGGFEIKTTPATLEAHYLIWEKFFEGTNRKYRAFYVKSGSCGMHVHVNAPALSMLELGKFVRFYNCVENKAFLDKVAGRDIAGQYCAIKDIHTADVFAARDFPRQEKLFSQLDDAGLERRRRLRNYTRYSPVNLTNPKTFEVRIFRGNVSKLGFFKNLEFVDATRAFVKETSAQKLLHTDFLAWLAHAPGYPYLTSWLSMHGYPFRLSKLSEPEMED